MRSPNWSPRPDGLPVTALVLHYTGMQTASAARARLCDPRAEVSAHYLVDEDGTVDLLVDEDKTAWHAGRSAWRHMNALNPHSIGIEIVNPGHEWGYRAFPQPQIESVSSLAFDIQRRHCIPPINIVAHSDIAPARKMDPGELFPWQHLASAGLGLWPEPKPGNDDEQLMHDLLTSIGYRIDQSGTNWSDIVRAFQRRYLCTQISGCLDKGTMARIRGLAALIE